MALSRPVELSGMATPGLALAAPRPRPALTGRQARRLVMVRRRQPGLLLLAASLAGLALHGAGGAGAIALTGCVVLGLAQLCRPAPLCRAAALGLAVPLWLILLALVGAA